DGFLFLYPTSRVHISSHISRIYLVSLRSLWAPYLTSDRNLITIMVRIYVLNTMVSGCSKSLWTAILPARTGMEAKGTEVAPIVTWIRLPPILRVNCLRYANRLRKGSNER